MNNKGQVWGYSLMLGIVIIVLGLALAPLGQDIIDEAMNASTSDLVGLDCDNTTNNFVRGTCTITDFSLAYFFGGIILIGLGVIVARVSFTGGNS